MLNEEESDRSSRTKNLLIKTILDSLRTKSEEKSDRTERIFLEFFHENELGKSAELDELVEKFVEKEICSCQNVGIRFDDRRLNELFSYKQKRTILRVVLRREQIFRRYFSSSN